MMSESVSETTGRRPFSPLSKEEMKERNPFTLEDLEAAQHRADLKEPGYSLAEVLKRLRDLAAQQP